MRRQPGKPAQRRDEGSVAVEFALVVLPLLGLMFAIVETGLAFLFGLSVENATQQLARLIQTGQPQQAGVSSLQALKDQFICPPSGKGLFPSFVDCTRLIVDVRTATSFSGADTSATFYAGQLEYCPGTSNQIVVVRMAYGMPLVLPLLIASNSVFGPSSTGLVNNFPGVNGWVHLLATASVFQSETPPNSNNGSSQGSTSTSTSSGSSC